MTPKTPESIRAALARDPNTPRLAAAVNMELEDYVRLVVYFATTGAQPSFFVVPDAELKKRGHTPPDLNRMRSWLRQAVAVKSAWESTGFTPASSKGGR